MLRCLWRRLVAAVKLDRLERLMLAERRRADRRRSDRRKSERRTPATSQRVCYAMQRDDEMVCHRCRATWPADLNMHRPTGCPLRPSWLTRRFYR